MNILVIGNGFDLAHDLKTSYKDFLFFVECFKKCYKSNSEQFNILCKEYSDHIYIDWFLKMFNESQQNSVYKDMFDELNDLLTDNIWIDHFETVSINESWIDFEKEISRVIRKIDHAGNGIEQIDCSSLDLSDAFNSIKYESVLELKKRLLKDLNRTIRALELYLTYFVEEEQLQMLCDKNSCLPIISGLKIDKVISFNYTNTYELLYGKDKEDVKYDYIHGYAKKAGNVNTSNLVLGIDEYLSSPEKDDNNDFIEFKKFFQRIYKKTGSRYKIWLGEYNRYIEHFTKATPLELKVYYYGHSLDVTDRDIISQLIRQKNAISTIFYHNRKALSEQICNLVKVLGEDELIARTGDYKPSIIFQPLNNNDEFEIMNNQIR